MASKFETEIEMKSPAGKVWKNLKEFATILPKAVPDRFEKVDVIEGDGRSVGTVFVVTLKPSEFNPVVTTTKERIEMLDEEKKIVSYSLIEGEVLKIFKNYKAMICVRRSKNDGTIIKYSAEFEKANADVPDPHHFFGDYVTKFYQGLDDYLLKA